MEEERGGRDALRRFGARIEREPPHRAHGAQAGLAAPIVAGGLIVSLALNHQDIVWSNCRSGSGWGDRVELPAPALPPSASAPFLR